MSNPVEKIELLENAHSGGGIFDITGFTIGKTYNVRGVTQKRYADGETVPCYLVIDDNGILREVQIEKFKVLI